MKNFIITIILLLAGGTIVSYAGPPIWNDGTTETITLSMVNSAVCDSPIATVLAASGDRTRVTYDLTSNNYGITLKYKSFQHFLHCTWATLSALDSSVSSIDIVVSATNSGLTANKTFTFLLRDRYAPVFQNSLDISITKCVVSNKYSDGDVIYTVQVTDDDVGDVVTLNITTTGTPFEIRNFELSISNVSALESIFESSDTYTFDIQASDQGNKHTTTGTIRITYDRNTACNGGGNTVGNSNGNGNGTDNGDDNGFSSMTYNLFIICFLILIARVLLE